MCNDPIFTPEDMAVLVDAIKQGVSVVKYADKTVEYRSMSDMLALLRLMQSHICPPDPCSAGAGNRRFAQFDKGVL